MSTETQLSSLADLIKERNEGEASLLWSLLMRCRDCDDRLADHDEVAMVCLLCSCDQAHRGLSAYADEQLMEYGRAMKEAEDAGWRRR